jgi:hypothetical protein
MRRRPMRWHKQDWVRLGIGITVLLTLIVVISGIVEGWRPYTTSFTQDSLATPRAMNYLALLWVMLIYAVLEGRHDAKKILAHEEINHNSSVAGRSMAVLAMVASLGMWNHFTLAGVLLNVGLVLVSFSFIFNLILNKLRGKRLDWMTFNPGPYDGFFKNGRAKLITEGSIFLLAIIRIFVV